MTVDELINELQEIRNKGQLVVDDRFNLIQNISESDNGYVVLY